MKSLLRLATPIENQKSKIKNCILFLFVALYFVACREENFNGQFPVDSVPPAPVTLMADGVVNFPGGATITYLLPDETDLLCVKAVYQRSDGSVNEEIASAFFNSISLRGFGKSAKVKVLLFSVDKSLNESQPVEVEIHPEDSPIYAVLETLQIKESFGGFTLQWDNPTKEKIVIQVIRPNDEGGYENVDNFYSEAASAKNSVRGQESVTTEFGIFIRDANRNYTDTLRKFITPWFETVLDNSKFTGITRSSKFTISIYGTGDMSVLWDGILIGSGQPGGGVYYFAAGEYNPYFAINLGVKAKLSRFRYWGRFDYYFRLYHAKEIQIYGTNDPAVGNNPESDNSQWILLNPEIFVSVRPSGADVDVPATGEDYEYALAGEEWEFPMEAPAVQWVRFQQLATWTGSTALNCAEIRFWGDPDFKEE